MAMIMDLEEAENMPDDEFNTLFDSTLGTNTTDGSNSNTSPPQQNTTKTKSNNIIMNNSVTSAILPSQHNNNSNTLPLDPPVIPPLAQHTISTQGPPQFGSDSKLACVTDGLWAVHAPNNTNNKKKIGNSELLDADDTLGARNKGAAATDKSPVVWSAPDHNNSAPSDGGIPVNKTNIKKTPRPTKQTAKKKAQTTKTKSQPRKSTKRDPNKPKKRNAHNFFMKEQYSIIKNELSNKDGSTEAVDKCGPRSAVTLLVNEKWKALPPEEKAKYEKKASDDKIRYKKEMEIYNAKLLNAAKSKSDAATLPSQQNNNRTVVNNNSQPLQRIIQPPQQTNTNDEQLEESFNLRHNQQVADAAAANAAAEPSNHEALDFGGHDDNSNIFDVGDVPLDDGEVVAGIQDLLQGYGSDEDSVEPTAKKTLKIDTQLEEQVLESHQEGGAKSPTDVNKPQDSVPNATGNPKENTKTSTAANNTTNTTNNIHSNINTSLDEDEKRIAEISVSYNEKTESFKARMAQILKNLSNEQDQMKEEHIAQVAKVRVERYNHEVSSLEPALPQASMGTLLEEKRKLESGLEKARAAEKREESKKESDEYTLGLIKDDIESKEKDLTRVNAELDPLAGKKTSLKRKFEGMYHQDLVKIFKIDGVNKKAPAQVSNMWDVRSKD